MIERISTHHLSVTICLIISFVELFFILVLRPAQQHCVRDQAAPDCARDRVCDELQARTECDASSHRRQGRPTSAALGAHRTVGCNIVVASVAASLEVQGDAHKQRCDVLGRHQIDVDDAEEKRQRGEGEREPEGRNWITRDVVDGTGRTTHTRTHHTHHRHTVNIDEKQIEWA